MMFNNLDVCYSCTMKKTVWPHQYFHTTNHDKPIEEIWDDIDAYTFEEMYIPKEKQKDIDFVVPLPPLDYKGKKTKGIFYSQGADVILEKFPRLKEIFFVVANSMFASYPWAKGADAFFTCYKNEKREEHYLKKYPERKGTYFLPLQDADFLNEYVIAPTFYAQKTIDVFCVSTAYPVKNMPIIAKALIEYEKKYKKRLKVVYAIGSRLAKKLDDGTMDYQNVRFDAKAELDKVGEILGGDIKKYIDFYPYIDYKDLPKFYSSAKCCVLASLMEGKNRFLSEAMSCNTPVIVFRDFNKYARGDYPIFFENSGEYVEEFSPVALADAIHKVIFNQNSYEPRKNYLKYSGRKNFINKITDEIPYFAQNIPEFEKGRIHDNVWVDLACQINYQLSYHDFLYGKNPAISFVRGMDAISSLIEFYYSRFGIK